MKRFLRAAILSLSMAALGAFWAGCQSPEMTSAKIYIQQNDWAQALDHLRLEIKSNPQNADAYYVAGQVAAEMDSVQLMVDMFTQAEKLNPALSGEITQWRKSKAGEALKTGNDAWKKNSEPISELFAAKNRFAASNPDSLKKVNSKIETWTKNTDKAITSTKLATVIDPKYKNAWENLAYLYAQKADRFRAEDREDSAKAYDDKRFNAYKNAFEASPNDDELAFIFAGLNTQRGNTAEALKILEPRIAATKNPKILTTAAHAYNIQAKALAEKENPSDDDKKQTAALREKMISVLSRAETLDSTNINILVDIGESYYRIENYTKAAEYYGRAYTKDNSKTEFLYNRALALLYDKNFAECEKVARDLIAKDIAANKKPVELEYWKLLINALINKGDSKTAVEVDKVVTAISAGKLDDAKKLAAPHSITW